MSNQSTDLPTPPVPAGSDGKQPLPAAEHEQPATASSLLAPCQAASPSRRQRVSVLALLSRSLTLMALLMLVGCANNVPLPKTDTTAAPTRAEPAAAPEVNPEVQRVFDQAVALLRQQQYSQVVDALSPLAAEHPELPGLLVNLAVAYIHLERQEQATAVLQQALSTDPQHPVALNWLAILERRAGRFEEAKALYQRLLAAHPESRHGHLNLGILCDLYLRQAGCALEHYRRYQELAAEADSEVDNWIADLERRRQQG